MKDVCSVCSGSGTIEEQDGRLRECECALIRRAVAMMTPQFRKADLRHEHVRTGILDLTEKSLFINVHWPDMKAIIKGVMIKFMVKPPPRFVRFTSDAEIRDVYVGSKSKSARSADYDGTDIYNNLEDLVGPPDLLIVKLNEIGNKNKAAPGALAEALSHRVDRDKPTWVVSCAENRFVLGSYAYSAAVYSILEDGCSRFNIPQIIKPKVGEDRLFLDLDPAQQASPEESDRAREGRRAARDEERASGLADDAAREKRRSREKGDGGDPDAGGDPSLSRYGQGLPKKSKTFKKGGN